MRCRATGATRCGTATRCTRSTPSGGRSSTATRRPARRSPRHGSTPPRRPRYASREGLGQAFNFDLLEASFDAATFRRIVDANLALAAESGSSTTWVLSNHDVVRHATRYGLPEPVDPGEKHGAAWLLSGGLHPVLDAERGLRRARAATLFMLGLPGSAYLYQGEELGLHEVADIPPSERQDPAYFRNPGVDVGRDGCRVPIPWRSDGTSFGFGPDGSHLPQPAWFAGLSVEAQQGDPASTLELYRRALELRRALQGPERLAWLPTERDDVVRFRRHGGWEVVINFGDLPVPMPAGEVLVASGPAARRHAPGGDGGVASGDGAGVSRRHPLDLGPGPAQAERFTRPGQRPCPDAEHDELGRPDRREAHQHHEFAGGAFALRRGVAIAADEVRVRRRVTVEGPRPEQVVQERPDGLPDLLPQRLVVRLEHRPLQAALDALLEEERRAPHRHVLPLARRGIAGRERARAPHDRPPPGEARAGH